MGVELEAYPLEREATDSTITSLKINNKPVGVTATRTHHGGVSLMKFVTIDV